MNVRVRNENIKKNVRIFKKGILQKATQIASRI